MTEHPHELDLTKLPRLRSEEVKLLWVSNFWDGPLEGMAEYRGERCFYVVAEQELIAARDEMRRWVLYRLTPEQLGEEERWHALFVRHVGAHFDFTGTPAPEGAHPHPERFYEPYQAEYRPPLLGAGQALGWVEDFASSSGPSQ
ncbi:hypothetical protein FJV41_26625 [Myxococcus llanfairpwllgwyngyllgogerychwyrndrobwllllantysiliogogogochensis]|uniref:Uncharacterized protein n=1 Tax=Myxococcus llanfairpwllgwyngyllgogerychwyrndrobwllllantysiliogogogochensis TaxID=2590453 RepID=A0A540WV78_9BACT|nr:hypothetical protein [Myxococcus llanfairpwllgwyngyllgogerychwyrndrobwllllantysiliogogogochensis]TQF12896.1 hypothetical protein FJV41_26625 [Myxococcus llanfairpwllgwyngyllgogerychwyrndrobwllllantysiliogogogochensis]